MSISKDLVRDYLDEFFGGLILDPARKNFWEKYADHISDIKVVGPASCKRLLSKKSYLTESLDQTFLTTASTIDDLAIVISIGAYDFIEFSNLGNSMYAYKQDSKTRKMLTEGKLRSVIMLKQPLLPTFSEESCEGSFRLLHKAGWEQQLSNWMTRHVEC